ADLDRDGSPDIVGGSCKDPAALAVMWNKGDGTFGVPSDVPAGASVLLGLATGDIDEDGLPDLVAINYDKETAAVIRNLGGRRFAAPDTFDTGPLPVGVVLGDLDRNGATDLVVTNQLGTARVFLNQGKGTFAPKVDYYIGDKPWS